MEITNHSPYEADLNPGLMPDGRSCLIVVVKASYDFPDQITPDQLSQPLTLAEKQTEIHEADEFIGEPGYSSPLHENDYATQKPKCDVIIKNAVAYAPEDEPSERVEVSLQFNSINKTFAVIGPRHWEKKALGLMARPSEPEIFTEQALSWEIAYGGSDESAYEEEDLSDSYLQNPIGTGYWHDPDPTVIENTAIAQTEETDKPITKPTERHPPQGFGPMARNWQPRSQYGGTYDKQWEQDTKPFLPDDFNPLYYQCAPVDQQIDYPKGGEIITLNNLTPDGILQFALPTLDVPITVKLKNGNEEALEQVIDTITLDMKTNTVSIVARTVHPLKNTVHEVREFIVGIEPAAKEPMADEDNDDNNDSNGVQYYDSNEGAPA